MPFLEREVNKMGCNRYKSRNYKSAIQFLNTTPQLLTATSLIGNPITVALGNKITDTGLAFELSNNSIDVDYSGLYVVDADVNIVGTVAGDVYFAIALNGIVLPETIRSITTAADIYREIHTRTVRPLNVCNSLNEYNFSIVAWSDGTGTTTIERVAGNIIKLA